MLKKLLGIAMPFLCLLFFISNDTKAQNTRYGNTEIFTDNQIISINDIIYGSAQNNLNIIQSLTLDLYLPDTLIDTITALPLVIFVHGGSFKGGDKNSFDDYCEAFAKRGYAAATINYRTGWNKGGGCTGDPLDLNRAFYRCLQDINASIRYLSYFHNTYHINPDQIFLAGESSGAASILHAAFADNNEILSLTGSSCLMLGPLGNCGNHYNVPYHIKGCMNLIGGLFSDELIQSNDDIAVISFQGTADTSAFIPDT